MFIMSKTVATSNHVIYENAKTNSRLLTIFSITKPPPIISLYPGTIVRNWRNFSFHNNEYFLHAHVPFLQTFVVHCYVIIITLTALQKCTLHYTTTTLHFIGWGSLIHSQMKVVRISTGVCPCPSRFLYVSLLFVYYDRFCCLCRY